MTTATITDQQVVVVFEALLGCSPRAADLAVLHTLAPSGLTATDLALYIFDHWLGEPGEPTLEQVATAVREVLTGDERR